MRKSYKSCYLANVDPTAWRLPAAKAQSAQ